jgi:hypothetical protein
MAKMKVTYKLTVALLAAVALVLAYLTFSSAHASAFDLFKKENTFLPMAIKGEIPNPSVLADRVEESLKSDPSGNSTVRGANISAEGFLTAVRTAGGTVKDVAELPQYLRSLQSGPMPSKPVSLSRATPDGHGGYFADTSAGWMRSAHPGEQGWYDQNTGYLILAGDCSNSPISPVARGVVIPILKGEPMEKATAQKRRDPYGGMNTCALGTDKGRWLTIHLMEMRAAEHACAKQYLLPRDGRVKGDAGDWMSPDRFSRQCGQAMHEAVKAEKLSFSETARRVEVVVVEGDDERPIFKGTVAGGGTFATKDLASQAVLAENSRAILIPEQYKSGYVVAYVDGQLPSGIGEDLANFRRGCHVKAYTAVEGYYDEAAFAARH